MSWYKRLILPTAGVAAGTGIGVLLGQDPVEAAITSAGTVGGMMGGSMLGRRMGQSLATGRPQLSAADIGAGSALLGSGIGGVLGGVGSNLGYGVAEEMIDPNSNAPGLYQEETINIPRRFLTTDQEAYYYPY